MPIIRNAIILFLCTISTIVSAQNGSISGTIVNKLTNQPIPFANIVLDSASNGTTSNIDGKFVFSNLNPGAYNITCSYIGFETSTKYEILVFANKNTNITFELSETYNKLKEVTISANTIKKMDESPVSLQTISAAEIYRNPGGNRDISKVIQSLPGVASSNSFRNDIIVRGGAPNENRFFIDGIEIPNINHFATQGSSGGPVGMLNVNFIREVDFYAGAFPVNAGNALSSVLFFKQVNGNPDKLTGNVMLGSSDFGITLDGPTGEKSNFIFSYRRSYLQLLFKALALPFLPTYNDVQYKHRIQINNKNIVQVLALGAFDTFQLNKSVNDNLTDAETIERNNYILGNLPSNDQWNYTIGATYQHFGDKGNQLFVISQSKLHNEAKKYTNNIEVPENLTIDYISEETENKFRFEQRGAINGWKYTAGLGFETGNYTTSTFSKVSANGQAITIDYSSELGFLKYAAFFQTNKRFINDRLSVAFGARTDFNDYNTNMNNPLDQLSPRVSASFNLTNKLALSANIGKYFQLPPYTSLGYRNNNDQLVNQPNLTYISTFHKVVGLAYYPTKFSKITLEGFNKTYQNYPYLTDKGISLANLGSDFGVIGNEPATSTSKGESNGIELLAQQRLSSSVYGILSYTFVRSKFTNASNSFVPSAWDNQHIVSLTVGKKLKRNWEIGTKFRFLGGAPYTPFNTDVSAQKIIWEANKQGIPDWSRINTLRLKNSHGLDVRIDKKWFFEKSSLNLYVDVQNVYGFKAQLAPYLNVVTDENNNPVTDPNNPNAYQTKLVENNSGTVLPSIGMMFNF